MLDSYYKIMTRIKAVSIHLLISLAVVSSVITYAVIIWYPDIYSQTDEFIAILWLLATVDITLGPLLTAVVFKPQKKSLKFDLSVIALLQMVALSYGVNTLFTARPVFIVFNIDRLTVVSAVDIPISERQRASPDYQKFSYTGPILVGSHLPDDPQERERILTLSILNHVDLAQLPQNYVPYEQVTHAVLNQLKSFDVLIKHKPEYQAVIQTALSKLHVANTAVGYLPVIAKSKDTIAVISRENGQVLKYLPINAW